MGRGDALEQRHRSASARTRAPTGAQMLVIGVIASILGIAPGC